MKNCQCSSQGQSQGLHLWGQGPNDKAIKIWPQGHGLKDYIVGIAWPLVLCLVSCYLKLSSDWLPVGLWCTEIWMYYSCKEYYFVYCWTLKWTMSVVILTLMCRKLTLPTTCSCLWHWLQCLSGCGGCSTDLVVGLVSESASPLLPP